MEDEMKIAITDDNGDCDLSNEQEIIDYLMRFTTKQSREARSARSSHLDRSNTNEPLKVTTAAIRSLVRRLKRKDDKSGLENLITCIRDGDHETACIKINRSLDGRMQVAQRKVVPHMCYYRIFRNWFVNNYHDLEARITCRFSYADSQHTGFVCLNPYHYEQKKSQDPGTLIQTNDNQHQGYGEYMDTASSQSPSSSYYSSEQPINNNVVNNFVPQMVSVRDRPVCQSSQVLPDNNVQLQTNQFLADSNCSPTNETSQGIVNNWLKIAYYEETRFVGDFITNINPVVVDGGCSPFDNGRFCLRSRSPIDRDSRVECILAHIGRGISIKKENFEILLQNNTQQGIFIQSMEWNLRENKPDKGCVRKILPGERKAIFCIVNFAKHLQERVHSIFRGSPSEASSYQQVAEMGHMCVVRCSFIKGWGPNYTRRRITSCPCWIEISFLKCYEWLDKVMNQMGPPDGVAPTSFS